MNLLFGEAHHVDELERALYNAVLGGIDLAGNHYYYQNPLMGDGLRRWEWHACPCCPPMFLKIMGALPGYVYAQEADAVYVNLFVGSRAILTVNGAAISLRQTTHYPWDGQVNIAIDAKSPVDFDLMIRIPRWCQALPSNDDLYRPVGRPVNGAASLSVNGQPVDELEMVRGYVRLRCAWQAGDVVELALDMPVRQVVAHPQVEADRGLVALMRGPLLYCAESVDNFANIESLIVPPAASFTAEWKPELLGGVMVVRGQVRACRMEAGQTVKHCVELTAVPFFASANRDPGAMRVWLANSQDKAVPAISAAQDRVSVSPRR